MHNINEDGETYMNIDIYLYIYREIYKDIYVVSRLMRMPQRSALDCDLPATFMTKLYL